MKKLTLLFALILLSQLPFTVLGQSKTAHVNTQTLMDTLPSRKKALAEIQEITRQGEAELAEMDQQLQKSYDDYLLNSKNQSTEMNQYAEGKLKKLQQNIQDREKELNMLIQNMMTDLNNKTVKTIQEAVKNTATKKGYQYVLEEATTVYAGGISITNDVIPELLRLDLLASN